MFLNFPHWVVGENRYYNQFETWQAVTRTSQTAKFCLYDDEFNSVDWTQDPAESWDELLRIRCLQLRHKYKNLALLYSGGRDSHCILRTFIKNKIPLDEIIMADYVQNPVRTQEYKTWIRPLAEKYKQHNPQVKITTITVDVDDYKKFYGETWSERPTATLINGLFQPSDYTWLIDQKCKITNSNTGIVCGLEKPELLLKDNKVYSITTDRPFMHFFHNQNLMEFFYISPDLPDLHVKQSWLSLNYLASHYPTADEVVKKIVQEEAPDVWNHYQENLNFFYKNSTTDAIQGKTRPDSFWLGAEPIEGNHYLMCEWPAKIQS